MISGLFSHIRHLEYIKLKLFGSFSRYRGTRIIVPRSLFVNRKLVNRWKKVPNDSKPTYAIQHYQFDIISNRLVKFIKSIFKNVNEDSIKRIFERVHVHGFEHRYFLEIKIHHSKQFHDKLMALHCCIVNTMKVPDYAVYHNYYVFNNVQTAKYYEDIYHGTVQNNWFDYGFSTGDLNSFIKHCTNEWGSCHVFVVNLGFGVNINKFLNEDITTPYHYISKTIAHKYNNKVYTNLLFVPTVDDIVISKLNGSGYANIMKYLE